MGLFNQLLSLSAGQVRQEDFFTELVAFFFRHDSQLKGDWISKFLEVPVLQDEEIQLETQVPYSALNGEVGGSRPDLVVRIGNSDSYSIVFIESKIGSQEGENQLKGYAKVLGHYYPTARQRVLVFITHYYEPKDEKEILRDLKIPIKFVHKRWREFYQFIQAYRSGSDDFFEEFCRFMEESGMASTNTFTPLSILALQNISASYSLMEESLDGEVKQGFQELFGLKGNKTFQPRLNFYTLDFWFTNNWGCRLGYWMEPGDAYPQVGVKLELYPKEEAQARSQIEYSMESLSQREGWKGNNLKHIKSVQTVKRCLFLNEFLNEKDHLSVIKKFFLSVRDDLEKFRNENANLPWNIETSSRSNDFDS